jgi:iron complex outermembrane recepter protein
VDAPVEQGNVCGIDLACAPYNAKGQDFVASFTTTDTLPFLTVNYRMDTNWSVYAEYAKGIYVPDISAFEGNTQTTTFPKAETTTNYQVGTVYYADRFTFDADIYYIPIENNYISQPCTNDTSDTCFINNGSATYEGIEGEGTYAFDNLLGMDAQGLSMFANGAIMRSVAEGGLRQPNAPYWTAALGVLYQGSNWRFGIIDKYIGQQYSDVQNFQFYKLPAYGNLTATLAYDFGNYEIALSGDNLTNSRATTLITEDSKTAPETNPATSNDQYIFQAPRSLMVTLKAHL